jgi:proteasome lid subunit RPN8/RPN11
MCSGTLTRRRPLRSLIGAERTAVEAMLADPPRLEPAAIRERLKILDALMRSMPSDSSSGSLYQRLATSETYLLGVLSDLAAGRRPSRSAPTLGRAAVAVRSTSDYAAAEMAWQASGGFAGTAGRERWRLPEPSRTTVETPSIRLDADTSPRVKLNLSNHAYETITAECNRFGNLETGGWLTGHPAFSWHGERSITGALSAASKRRSDSAILDGTAFTREDDRLRREYMEDRGSDLRLVGDWHSHPAGTATPSPSDVACWAREFATIADHNSSLTSLIVTPRRGSWGCAGSVALDHQARAVIVRRTDGVRTRDRERPVSVAAEMAP